jgi:hypothetical protein
MDDRQRIAQLELDLALARQHAVNYEHEVHALRKEIQRLRMECDTERITRDFDPHDIKASND